MSRFFAWLLVVLVVAGIILPSGQARDESAELAKYDEDLEEADEHEADLEEDDEDGDHEELLEEDDDQEDQPLLAQECLELAEQVEVDIGLFDAPTNDVHKREALARAMKKHALTLTGKDSPGFEQHFQELLARHSAAGSGMGAAIACKVLLDHHVEL
mmetsp:Transcript_53449/g.86463  ORF Transcript_53449/g.86463 Transcript_53449/m.86463 type:complete len:158 (-) Transcript_53449:276-749(-)